MSVDSIKWMYFRVNELEFGFSYSIFSGNENQKMYLSLGGVRAINVQLPEQLRDSVKTICCVLRSRWKDTRQRNQN